MQMWKEENLFETESRLWKGLLREDYNRDKKEYEYLRKKAKSKSLSRSIKSKEVDREIMKVLSNFVEKANSMFNDYGITFELEENVSWPELRVFNTKDELSLNGRRLIYFCPFLGFFDKDRNESLRLRKNLLSLIGKSIFNSSNYVNDLDYNDKGSLMKLSSDINKKTEQLSNLIDRFEKELDPLLDEAISLNNKRNSIENSYLKNKKKDYNSLSFEARDRAFSSYNKEMDDYVKNHPLKPGDVAIWSLQSGNTRTVEIKSIDNTNNTAKIITDGGSVRNVPLDRLSVIYPVKWLEDDEYYL